MNEFFEEVWGKENFRERVEKNGRKLFFEEWKKNKIFFFKKEKRPNFCQNLFSYNQIRFFISVINKYQNWMKVTI